MRWGFGQACLSRTPVSRPDPAPRLLHRAAHGANARSLASGPLGSPARRRRDTGRFLRSASRWRKGKAASSTDSFGHATPAFSAPLLRSLTTEGQCLPASRTICAAAPPPTFRFSSHSRFPSRARLKRASASALRAAISGPYCASNVLREPAREKAKITLPAPCHGTSTGIVFPPRMASRRSAPDPQALQMDPGAPPKLRGRDEPGFSVVPAPAARRRFRRLHEWRGSGGLSFLVARVDVGDPVEEQAARLAAHVGHQVQGGLSP